MGKLSTKELRNALVKDSTYYLDDGDGLRLRVTPDGEKAWQVRYNVAGYEPSPSPENNDEQIDGDVIKKRREVEPKTGARTITLSRRYGAKTDDAHLSLDGARDQARIIRAQAREGKDFQKMRRDDIEAERKAEALRKAQALTVRNLFDAWHAEVSVKRGKKGRKDGGVEVKRALEKDVLPILGRTLLTALTGDDVSNTMRRISDRGHNRLAVILLRDFKQMLRYGESRQPWKRLLVECDALAIDDEDVVKGDYDNVRTRALEEGEIIQLKTALPASGMTGVVQAAIWVMLSVGTRVGETVATEWKHVNLGERTWHIPKENTKTQTAITVFLSDFTLAIFEELDKARLAKDPDARSKYVFPSRTSHLKPLDGQTVGKALKDRQRLDGKPITGRTPGIHGLILLEPDELELRIKEAAEESIPLEKPVPLRYDTWKCHDLRRTAATIMNSREVPPDITHRCLNHARPMLDKVYDQYDYSKEMAQAWQKLGEHLSVLLSQNVIQGNFKRARK